MSFNFFGTDRTTWVIHVGDPQTSPQHADPHGLGAFFKRTIQEVHVDRACCGLGLWVAMSRRVPPPVL